MGKLALTKIRTGLRLISTEMKKIESIFCKGSISLKHNQVTLLDNPKNIIMNAVNALHALLYDAHTCAVVAGQGRLDVLRYLYENGCPWDKDSTEQAAGSGQLESLMFLHENGCPWDAEASYLAANNCNIACLEYLHMNDCPVDSHTCVHAIQGSIRVASRLNNEHFYDDEDDESFCEKPPYACIEYLVEVGCPMSIDVFECATNVQEPYVSDIGLIKYLIRKGCPYTDEMLKNVTVRWIPPQPSYIDNCNCRFHTDDEYTPDDVNLLESFSLESWFQKHKIIDLGVVNEHTLHIKHKIQRIQHAWIRYAFHPDTHLGQKRIERMKENVNAILGITRVE